jgi:4'-phosphopantetheinyl transferase
MNTNELEWNRAITPYLNFSNQVQVWRVFLDVNTNSFESLPGILSPDELERANRFHFEKDQRRFIVARAMLRNILSGYLEEDPRKIRFEYTSYGKPILATNSGFDTLHFNLSHSGEFALYAVAIGHKVGIDIESIRDDFAVGQIAQRFFSPGEISLLEGVQEDKRPELFFQYWTRKEAFIKGTGYGVSFPLEQCDVSSVNEQGLSPVTILGDNKENFCWHTQDLFPFQGYAAAIAIEGDDYDISCWEYAF